MPSPIQPEVDEIERLIGRVLWQLQAFEETLAQLIALMHKIPVTASFEEARKVLDDVRSGTLGRLLKQLQQTILIDSSFEVFLTKFLRQRNWLVHRSHLTHGHYATDLQTYQELKYRLNRLSMDAIEYKEFFGGIVENWLRERGITVDELGQLTLPDDGYADAR
jgi:hypothetical protein